MRWKNSLTALDIHKHDAETWSMHILFVTGEYPPQTGGVGAYTAELARAILPLGVEVTVLTTTQVADTFRGKKDVEDSVRVLPIVGRWGMGAVAQIARTARTLDADWIHVQFQTAAFGMNPALHFGLLALGKSARTAWTYHDLLVPYLFPKAGAGLRRWVVEHPAHHADLVIATNEGDYRQLQKKLGARSSHLHQIPIGSNVRGIRLDAQKRVARRTLRGYTDEQVVVGYFGALNRSKGGMTLLRTLQRLVAQGQDAHLLMIGDGLGASDPTNAAYLAEVEQAISEVGLRARVRWTGRESDKEVSADLNAVDVCLMPYADGASLRRGTLMAALANGCAIVTTTPVAPIPELVAGRDLLYVAPGADDAAAAAIVRIVNDKTLAETLRMNARARSTLFTWDEIARRHRDLYATYISEAK